MRIYVVDVYEAVKDGKDRQTGRGMYIEFSRYIAAVCGHGID